MKRLSTGRTAAMLCSALAMFALSSAAKSAEPVVNAMTPWGLQRGAEIEVQFSGARLADAQQLLLYDAGIEVVKLEAVDQANVKATLKVAADCPLGIQALRLRAASGISNLRTFAITALPITAEAEPNSEFDQPQSVPLDTSVSGIVQNEDVDYFVVQATKGQRITAEIVGLRLGYTFFDPYVAILNASRFELARSDDAPLLQQDAVCSIVAPEDGQYVIQVRESAFGGDGNCKYLLHIGQFPRPRAVVPAGGAPGRSIDVTWLGDAAGARQQQLVLPTAASDTAPLFAQDEQGIAPSGNLVRLIDVPNVVEAELQQAQEPTAFDAPAALHGVVGEPGDLDRFRFHATKGQVFDVRVFARKLLRSPLDSVISIHRSSGAAVGSNDDSGGPDSYLRLTAPEDDDYEIRIRDHLQSGGPEFAYRIEVTPVQPKLTMALPERVQYVPRRLCVPRGNRMALLVGARRADFGGEVNVELRDLPAGVTVETVPVAGDRSDVPVLFTAGDDAAPAGTLADVVGRPADENLKIEGHLLQRTMLVRGQNNRDVWGHDAERMAAAVTEAVPFRLDIVQPHVPLVRNGSMALKVVATRNEGFTAPIAVSMLYNPPGVSSPGGVSIPEGQSEAVISLTANGSATIRDWKIAVIGRANTGNGSVEVSTQLADLSVADTYVDLTFGKSAVEQGQQTQVVVQMAKKTDFEGEARVELLGLPAGATTEPLQVTKDSTEMTFTVSAAADARVGRHKTLLCRVVIQQNGEPVTHTLGTGELRIDKPLPAAVAPPPKPEAKPAPAEEQPKKKVLSRLEQLRQQRQQQAAP